MTIVKRKDPHRLRDKRSFFIAERVVGSQVIFLLLTGVLTWLFHDPSLSEAEMETTLVTWGILAIGGVVGAVIIFDYYREEMYFRFHWIVTFLILALVWLPMTIFLGLLIDTYVAAKGNVLVVSILIIINLIMGYLIAGMFRMLRFKVPKALLLLIAIIITAVIILITAIIGATYGQIHVLLTGIGIGISLFFNYYMLFSLYEIEGMDVIEDPPNKLYYICLRNSIILTLIMWVLMATLFPPVAGGSGGSRKKKRRSSSKKSSSRRRGRRRRRYRRRRTYALRTYKGFPFDEAEVEKEWKEYNLGKDDID
ncbi:MAG: hypothetical protein ACFFCS_05540 [Candidatus Hodarchaeota archaeon]